MADQGINPGELSRRASLGETWVYDLLAGRNTNPTLNTLEAISTALNCSIPYLLGGTERTNNGSEHILPIDQLSDREIFVAAARLMAVSLMRVEPADMRWRLFDAVMLQLSNALRRQSSEH